jgi:phytoene dehydrogenase-like protein
LDVAQYLGGSRVSASIVVIGTGVNELVAAHYLARAGHSVLALEQGTAHEDAAFDSGWVPPQIARDLQLERGAALAETPALTIEHADPWIATVLPDGSRLELWHDMARSVEAIRRLNPRDAAKWPAFCARMARLARLLEMLYTAPPPDLMTRNLGELARLAGTAFAMRRLGRESMEDLLRILPMAVADLLDDWFECDALKAALAGAGVAHLCQGPHSGGTAFRLLHHHVGNSAGVFRSPVCNVRRVLAQRPGIALRPRAEVARIAVRDGSVASVGLASGEDIPASAVVSGADLRRTLLEWVEPGWLDPEFTRAVRHIRCRGVVARVTLTLDRAPGFNRLVVAPSLDYLERAYDDAKYGRISQAPYLEARDTGRDPDGGHRVLIEVQYAPYALAEGAWDEARRSALADRVVEMLAPHMPGGGAAVNERAVLSPRDLEAVYGFPEGQLHHAELALDQAFWMRPLPGWARYRMPIAGLYLCGPGTHPGGFVAGAAGANAGKIIIRDLRRGRRN